MSRHCIERGSRTLAGHLCCCWIQVGPVYGLWSFPCQFRVFSRRFSVWWTPVRMLCLGWWWLVPLLISISVDAGGQAGFWWGRLCVLLTFGRWLVRGCSVQRFSLGVRPQAKQVPASQCLVYSCVNAGPGPAEQWRECLFLWSFHGSLFHHSECSGNEPARLLREYWGICLFTPGFAVSPGRNFFFRAAWTVPAPWVQHQGFDGMREISGASQVPSAATSCLPPMGLSGQPRWQGAPQEEHRPIFPHWCLVENLAHWFCFIWPNVAILCQTRNRFEPYTSSKHTSYSPAFTCSLTRMVLNPKSFLWCILSGPSL